MVEEANCLQILFQVKCLNHIDFFMAFDEENKGGILARAEGGSVAGPSNAAVFQSTLEEENSSYAGSEDFQLAEDAQPKESDPLNDFKKQIESELLQLLASQREGRFTFRAVDCCHSKKVFLGGICLPCVVHGKNVNELGKLVT